MTVKTRGAFTLVELLASMALTTLLMLAIFQVLASVARQGRALAERERSTSEPWQADLINMLRWDLANAQSTLRQGERTILRGHGSLRRSNLSPRHAPADVSYFVQRIGGRNWLLRSETPSDGPAWTALVCPDVTRFDARAVGEAADGNSAGPANESPISARYALRVESSDGKALGETIVLR